MAKTATAQAPQVATKPRTPKTYTLDVGTSGRALLRKLSVLRLARLAAERAEKPTKDAAKLLYAAAGAKLKPKDRITLLAGGKPVGEVVCVEGQKECDLDLLSQGWPEAYEACVRATSYLKYSPA